MKLNLLILLLSPTLLFADFRILDLTRYSKEVIFSAEPTETEEATITLVRCQGTTKETDFNRSCKALRNPYNKPLTMRISAYVNALKKLLSYEKDPNQVDATIEAILERALAGNAVAPTKRSDPLAALALKPFSDLEISHKAQKLREDYEREEREKIQKAEEQKRFEATRPYHCTAEGVMRMQHRRPQEIGRGQDVKGYPRRYTGVSNSGLNKEACSRAAEADCRDKMKTTMDILKLDYLMKVEFECKVTSAVPK